MQALTRRILGLAAEVTRAKERVNSPQAQAVLPRGASRRIEFAERVSSAPSCTTQAASFKPWMLPSRLLFVPQDAKFKSYPACKLQPQ